MVKNVELINVTVDDITLQVKVLYKNIKYLRIKILPNRNIIISSKHRLKEKDVLEIINKNKAYIIKYLNKKRIVLDENEVLFFGEKYLKNEIDFSSKQKRAIEFIEKMFYEIKNQYNFEDVHLYFSKMKSRWGVCYPKKKRIGLSIYLTCVPIECIKYVIIHEFVHLKICDHSSDFYALLVKYYPDYKKAAKILKEYGALLN